MKSTVRRIDNALAQANDASLEQVNESPPAVTRQKQGLSVTSQKTLGMNPRILLTWSAEYHHWADGFRLMGFRSASGFAPDQHPENLSAHGQMILEETADGTLEERLPEGTHFYTFVLYKRTYFGLREKMNIVRFSETIPSARTAIGRSEDHLKLQQLREDHDLHGIKSQIARNEAMLALHRSNQKLAGLMEPRPEKSLEEEVRREVESIVRQKLKKAMTRIEMLTALRDVEKRLKRNPSWKKLDPKQQQKLMDDILEDLDADEENLQP